MMLIHGWSIARLFHRLSSLKELVFGGLVLGLGAWAQKESRADCRKLWSDFSLLLFWNRSSAALVNTSRGVPTIQWTRSSSTVTEGLHFCQRNQTCLLNNYSWCTNSQEGAMASAGLGQTINKLLDLCRAHPDVLWILLTSLLLVYLGRFSYLLREFMLT